MKRWVAPLLTAALAFLAAACGHDSLGKLFPKILVRPGTIDLGDVPTGVSKRFPVEVSNAGTAALEVSSIAFRTDPNAPQPVELAIALDDPVPKTLANGAKMTFEIAYSHETAMFGMGVARVSSNDPGSPNVDIPIVQLAIGAPKVAVVPNADTADIEADTAGGIKTTVQSIDFGTVTPGMRKANDLFVVNAGDGDVPLVVSGISIIDMGGTAGLSVSARPDLSASPVFLPLLGAKSKTAPTRSIAVEVAYEPPMGAAPLAAVLRIATSDSNRPVLDIPITGMTISCTPAQGSPLPHDDTCAGANDRGTLRLPSDMTQHGSWSDEVLYPVGDTHWTKILLPVDAGCSLVGYDVTATVMTAGETAEVCVFFGSCASPVSMQCGIGSAHTLLFPGDDQCNASNNELALYVEVKHTSGALSCMNYTLSVDAR